MENDLKPRERRRRENASKEHRRTLSYRVAQIETTVADLSDRLAALEDQDRSKAKGRGSGPAAKRAIAEIRQRVQSPDQKTSRAKGNRPAEG